MSELLVKGTYLGKTEEQWLSEADDYYQSWRRTESTDDWDNYKRAQRYASNAAEASYYGSSTSDAGSNSTLTSGGLTATNGYYVYTGGDQSIFDYAGEPIFLGTFPTGLNFEDDDFYFYSDSGELYIEDVKNIVIDFRDAWGNAFAKAYASDDPGIIDGRGLAGFEYIVGSDDGSDIIYAGNAGSYLWGNSGNATDVLIGGAGYDSFFTGKNEGNDAIQNASSADSVNLYDVSLSDITFTAEDNGTLGIAFNTGNVITIQSTEYISAKINLADGNSYRFNHATRSWQNA